MNRIKVGVALSGGVDSTSTAIMLREEYNVTGFFMQLAQPDIEQQVKRVSETADKIGIPLKIIDLSSHFQQEVLNYFCNSYFNGLTPNPCIICNRKVKFGSFLDAIISQGMDKAATGHYAKVYEKEGSYRLAKGRDRRKDQSYFLSRLTQQQLSKILFPLGDMRKENVFDFAERHGFRSFRGNESQDVCFLENRSVAEFLQEKHAGPPLRGSIVDSNGKELGSHMGIFNYTVGQRRGLGVSGPHPYYVVAIDHKNNTVIVGSNEDLYKSRIELKEIHWITGSPPDFTRKYRVKIRYTHSGSEAEICPIDENRVSLSFAEPQRAVTPGQFGVIYDGDLVVGSGEIVK